ncbi:rhombosortase [Rheinheimera salexigens]|uniref:Rhombosortase n=1 Tax=Rheinheimera salexigens TaxID=1628148 RepID=A0A1E7Q1Y2_9GAMM|nr:rhombosortase [Rheinheimera salexigens]OEY68205.1 rhombosortase [Rheinheimera salexigens]
MLRLGITLPLAQRHLLPVLMVAALLGLLFLLPEHFANWLMFEREALKSGQLWRLFSGQFMHLSLAHLLLNLSGIAMFWLLFAEYTAGWRFLWLLPLLALGCSTGIWFFASNIDYYVGFSGVLYGLFAWGALQDVMQRQPFSRLLLLVIITKVSYEFIFSPIPIAAINANPLATAAHFFGVISALMIISISYLFSSKLHRNT